MCRVRCAPLHVHGTATAHILGAWLRGLRLEDGNLQGIQSGEIFRALAVFVEPPSAEHEAVAASLGFGALPGRAEHTDVFDFQFFPFASVYLGAEGMQGGEARDRIAGFWRVLELEPPKDPDHLTVLLAAYGALLDRTDSVDDGEAENWRHVTQVFLHEHILSWLPILLARLEASGSAFYGAWAGQLQRLLALQPLSAELVAIVAAALREAAELPDPRSDGGEAFLSGLLAPARSGFILTRDDLAELARELDLGRRVGERRYVLKNLLAQDAERVLAALAASARRAGEQYQPIGMPAANRGWWCARAAASSELLVELAAEAKELEFPAEPTETR